MGREAGAHTLLEEMQIGTATWKSLALKQSVKQECTTHPSSSTRRYLPKSSEHMRSHKHLCVSVH